MGHVTVVTHLLDDAAASLETTTARDETALHVAARARQTDVIAVLLLRGANVHAAATVAPAAQLDILWTELSRRKSL